MNLKQKFYSQDNIQHHFLHRDIHLWREELEGIAEEIYFFNHFLEAPSNLSEPEAVLKKLRLKLQAKQLENEVFLSRLTNFSVKLEGINECDDMQCETFYFNDYVAFKLHIESFLSHYRKLKKHIFLKLNNHSKTTQTD